MTPASARNANRRAELADLVRYAGASLDFNPIHFDADAARRAGLDDCVVHGMLIMGWAATEASKMCGGAENLATIKVRFRAPLYVGQTAGIEVGDEGAGAMKIQVRADNGDLLVTGSATCRGHGDGVSTMHEKNHTAET